MYLKQNRSKKEEDSQFLEGEVVRLLTENGMRVTTAESCTGGLISATLVNVSGASEVLEEGYVTYSNRAKIRLLGVRPETLERYGAVSEQTAREMAEGAAKAASADAALSTTGIAGPGGGSEQKPVGLVYIGCFLGGRTTVKKCLFTFDRTGNRKAAVKAALAVLKDRLDSEYSSDRKNRN